MEIVAAIITDSDDEWVVWYTPSSSHNASFSEAFECKKKAVKRAVEVSGFRGATHYIMGKLIIKIN